jgi:hypothetical protein
MAQTCGDDGAAKHYQAKSYGHVEKAFLMDLVEFAETCDALTPEDSGYIIDGISEAI